MTPRCPCGRFIEDGRFVCDRCETDYLNEIVESNRQHRRTLWRNRFLDSMEYRPMNADELRHFAREGSRRVADKRDHAHETF